MSLRHISQWTQGQISRKSVRTAKKMKGDEGLFFTDTLTNAVLSLDFWIIDYLEAKDSVVIPIEVKAATRGSMQSLWLFHYMQ